MTAILHPLTTYAASLATSLSGCLLVSYRTLAGLFSGPHFRSLTQDKEARGHREVARVPRAGTLIDRPVWRQFAFWNIRVLVPAEDLESISPLVRKTGRALSSLPSPRKNFHVIVTQGEKDLLLQLVHGDLVDLRVELALADLLATDAPVVLGHRRARLGSHFRA